jgi:hypothetical protein
VVDTIVLNEKKIWYNSLDYMQWIANNTINTTDDIANLIKVYGLIFRSIRVSKIPNFVFFLIH